MFEKSLHALVKGIRSTKLDVSVYISQCQQEIKNELQSTDPFVKAEALRKLTYLFMMGYDMGWADFHIVEVMSNERFAHKRIGYLAASHSFTQSTEVVLLCTNLFKKEFGSSNEYEIGLALNCMSNITTMDLARDLLGDIVNLMSSEKPYVRKKATLVLYKLFLRYPQGLRLTFEDLKKRMEDNDIAVVSSAVNVICELANKKPKNYLGLAPEFFNLLTTSSNNWMLIKVVKLMAALVPEEPRLARKLIDPLASIIRNTPAKSLLYECISTVTTALLYTKKADGGQPKNVPAVVQLCNDQLKRYIEDSDQNLKYLGLVGLGNLMESHPYVVNEHQEVILECLTGDDVTIRMRALDLITGMIMPENSMAIIETLMTHIPPADGYYRDQLIATILKVCSREKYHNVEDFEWYVMVLVKIAKLCVGDHGKEISMQLIDIAVRVESVRVSAVHCMIPLVLSSGIIASQSSQTMQHILYAAGWIVGEFAVYVDDEDPNSSANESGNDESEPPSYVEIITAMLNAQNTALPADVQAVFIHNILKLVAAAATSFEDEKDCIEECHEISSLIIANITPFLHSEHIEVQERAACLKMLLRHFRLGIDALEDDERAKLAFDGDKKDISFSEITKVLSSYFNQSLPPVNPKAQRKVPVPISFDLDMPFNSEETGFLVEGYRNSFDGSIKVCFVQEEETRYTRSEFDVVPSFGDSDYLKGKGPFHKI